MHLPYCNKFSNIVRPHVDILAESPYYQLIATTNWQDVRKTVDNSRPSFWGKLNKDGICWALPKLNIHDQDKCHHWFGWNKLQGCVCGLYLWYTCICICMLLGILFFLHQNIYSLGKYWISSFIDQVCINIHKTIYTIILIE